MSRHRKEKTPLTSRKFQILLHEVQAEFLACETKYRSFVGGRGSGKSYIGAYDLLTRAASKKNRLYMVVAPSFPVLRKSSLRTFLTLARKTGLLADFNKSEFVATLTSGSEIVFKSGEDPDGLRGPNISGLWLDEAQGIPEESFSTAIACLREDRDTNWCTATFTPKGKSHWTYERFAKPDAQGRPPADTTLFRSSTRNNPFLPADFEADIRRQYTSATAEQELEGEFLDAGGKMFKREWFNGQLVKAAPRECKRVRFWDKAALKNAGCYTCGTLMAATYQNVFYVENVIRGQWSTLERDEIIALTAEMDARRYGYGGVRIFIEQEPGSGGLDSIRSSMRQLAGHIVMPDKVTGDKRTRAEPFAAQCESKNVFLVDDEMFPWIRDWIDELCQFPDGKYLDQCDSASGAFNQLNRGVYSHPVAGGAGGSGGAGAGGASYSAPGASNAASAAVTSGLMGTPVVGGMGGYGLNNFNPR